MFAPENYVLPRKREDVRRFREEKKKTGADDFTGGGETDLYFNLDALLNAKWTDGKHATEEDVFSVAKEALFSAAESHVTQVYSRHQLENGVPDNFIARAVANGYYPRRSGDLFLIFEPGFVTSATGGAHFSPYSYDRHVPVLFMGPGIKPGRYNNTIQPRRESESPIAWSMPCTG